MAEAATPQYVPALRKGLALLELLADHGPMSLAQVERASGLNRTMAYRLLRVLGELGYVEHDPVRHQFGLGARLLGLGAAAAQRMNLADIALPCLDAVRAETQETVALGVLAGNQVIYLGLLPGAEAPEIAAPMSLRDAAHSTSVGKAILAFLPEAQRESRLAALTPLPSVTPATIVDPQALDQDLARTRERGYSLEDEENTPGARGVAVPVLDARGLPVAALALAGPADRIDLSRADRMAARLWRASREVSRRLDAGPEALAS
ncbi:MAG: IclR family transcriptional regulator [Thermomicrobiales bacterium]|nr:IclR family transcriptional regulator [Thermomicrobiales bacterium]